MRLSYRLIAGLFACLPMMCAQAAEVLHRPIDSEPDTLDPQKTTSAGPIAIDRDLFAGLAVLDAQDKPVPGAAESWDISADKRIWTFHLRRDATWSNGEPVTAADFLYSFRRLVDPATAAASSQALAQVTGYDAIVSGREKDLTTLGIEALDPYTLRITLTEPRAAFPLLLTDWPMLPLYRPAIEQWGAGWTQPGHLVSNGAYRLKSWTPHSDLVLEKNRQFYDAASVKIDEVHWLNVEDPASGLLRYRAGELDWIGLSAGTIGWAKQNLPDQYHFAPANGLTFMPINMSHGVLAQDVRLREALNLAVDRDVLVSKIDMRGAQPAYGILPPVITDYTGQAMDFRRLSQADRLARAKQLMAAAGYGPDHPLSLTVSYGKGDATRRQLLAIRAMWQQIGVDLKLDDMEFQVLMSNVGQRNYELAIMTATGDYNDYEFFLSGFRGKAGEFNVSGYSSAKFDDLFHRGSTAIDLAARRDLLQQAERVLVDDFPVIPISFDVINRLVNPRLEGPFMTEPYPQTRFLSFKSWQTREARVFGSPPCPAACRSKTVFHRWGRASPND